MKIKEEPFVSFVGINLAFKALATMSGNKLGSLFSQR